MSNGGPGFELERLGCHVNGPFSKGITRNKGVLGPDCKSVACLTNVQVDKQKLWNTKARAWDKNVKKRSREPSWKTKSVMWAKKRNASMIKELLELVIDVAWKEINLKDARKEMRKMFSTSLGTRLGAGGLGLASCSQGGGGNKTMERLGQPNQVLD